MGSDRKPRRVSVLRWLNLIIYLGACVLGFAALAPYLKRAWIVLSEPASVCPAVIPLILGVSLALFLLAASLAAVGRVLAGRGPRKRLSVTVMVAPAALLLFRLSTPLEDRAAEETYARAADYLQLAGSTLQRFYLRHRRYPEPASVDEVVAPAPSPWVGYGRPLPFHLVGEPGLGPRLQAREGDRPGTVYYVVAPGGERYWLSMLILAGSPTGRYDFLRDQNGNPLVLSRGKARP